MGKFSRLKRDLTASQKMFLPLRLFSMLTFFFPGVFTKGRDTPQSFLKFSSNLKVRLGFRSMCARDSQRRVCRPPCRRKAGLLKDTDLPWLGTERQVPDNMHTPPGGLLLESCCGLSTSPGTGSFVHRQGPRAPGGTCASPPGPGLSVRAGGGS